MMITVYSPFVSTDHKDSCAAKCTDYPGSDCEELQHDHGCTMQHECWCPDGSLSYAEFTAKHPDVETAEA